MSGRLSRLILLVACMSCGCARAPSGAEATPLLCNNGGDDDGDALNDCADPDCWSLELCGVPASSAAPGQLPDDEASLESPIDGPRADPFAPIPVDEDDEPIGMAGSGVTSDAGMPPDHTPDGGGELPLLDAGCDCDAGCEECPGITDEALGRFAITRIAIRVPRATNSDRCLDPADSCVIDAPNADFVRCRCAPDPQVAILLDDSELLLTEARQATDQAVWEALRLELDLYEGSRLGFEVLENDELETLVEPLTPAQPQREHVFDCEVVATRAKLATGSIECGRSFRTDLGADARFDVRVQLRKLENAVDP